MSQKNLTKEGAEIAQHPLVLLVKECQRKYETISGFSLSEWDGKSVPKSNKQIVEWLESEKHWFQNHAIDVEAALDSAIKLAKENVEVLLRLTEGAASIAD